MIRRRLRQHQPEKLAQGKLRRGQHLGSGKAARQLERVEGVPVSVRSLGFQTAAFNRFGQEGLDGLLVRSPRASEARLHVEHGQGPIVKLPRLRVTVGNRGHAELAVFGERADQVKQHA